MRSRYVKGRSAEYYIKDKFENMGYYVIRSAGSHGLFDLIAVKNGVALGIQIKTTNYVSNRVKQELTDAYYKYGIIPILIRKNKRRYVCDILIPNGNKQ